MARSSTYVATFSVTVNLSRFNERDNTVQRVHIERMAMPLVNQPPPHCSSNAVSLTAAFTPPAKESPRILLNLIEVHGSGEVPPQYDGSTQVSLLSELAALAWVKGITREEPFPDHRGINALKSYIHDKQQIPPLLLPTIKRAFYTCWKNVQKSDNSFLAQAIASERVYNRQCHQQAAQVHGIKSNSTEMKKLERIAINTSLGQLAANGEYCLDLAERNAIDDRSKNYAWLTRYAVFGKAGEQVRAGTNCFAVANYHGIDPRFSEMSLLMQEAVKGRAGERVRAGECAFLVARNHGIIVSSVAFKQLAQWDPRIPCNENGAISDEVFHLAMASALQLSASEHSMSHIENIILQGEAAIAVIEGENCLSVAANYGISTKSTLFEHLQLISWYGPGLREAQGEDVMFIEAIAREFGYLPESTAMILFEDYFATQCGDSCFESETASTEDSTDSVSDCESISMDESPDCEPEIQDCHSSMDIGLV